jgi:hypothetical protein
MNKLTDTALALSLSLSLAEGWKKFARKSKNKIASFCKIWAKKRKTKGTNELNFSISEAMLRSRSSRARQNTKYSKCAMSGLNINFPLQESLQIPLNFHHMFITCGKKKPWISKEMKRSIWFTVECVCVCLLWMITDESRSNFSRKTSENISLLMNDESAQWQLVNEVEIVYKYSWFHRLGIDIIHFYCCTFLVCLFCLIIDRTQSLA